MRSRGPRRDQPRRRDQRRVRDPVGDRSGLGIITVAAHSFPRSARLTRPSEFKRVFRQPSLSSDRCFRVLAVPGKTSVTRLGMAVSRRAERTAVGRNRIKRIVRESFRHRFIGTGAGTGDGPADVPLDIVVLPHPGCATISNAQLFLSLDAHWARIVAKFPVAPECP